ncbi:MAG: hypothetical protein LAT76_11590 [Schleiferiaceae bacterium]|nr:hypothetical protein [Schleiferiaceae bacterium]
MQSLNAITTGLLIVILATSCNLFTRTEEAIQKNAAERENKTAPFMVVSDSCGLEIEVNQLIMANAPGVFVESIAFQNPCLEVVVNYSGCREGEITVHWDGRVQEAYPPTVSLFIEVENAGECDQVLTQKLSISTKELKRYAGKKFYVRINTFKNTLPVSFLD